MWSNRLAFLIAIALVAALPACSRPPAHLFVMAPVSSGNTASQAADPTVAVIRVQLPGYLDRQEVVSREGANELKLSENDRWAEPLDESLPRIMAVDLTGYLGQRVVAPVEGRTLHPPYEYLVVLDSYEPNGAGHAVMRGRWHLRDMKNGRTMADGTINEDRPIASGGTSAVVDALNENVNEASRQIAEATRSVVGH